MEEYVYSTLQNLHVFVNSTLAYDRIQINANMFCAGSNSVNVDKYELYPHSQDSFNILTEFFNILTGFYLEAFICLLQTIF